MSGNAGKLPLARMFRGIARAMITHLEVQISKLESKPEIAHSNSMIIQPYMERLNPSTLTSRNIFRHH